MGESFKLHAQALSGYDDALLASQSGDTTPVLASPDVDLDLNVSFQPIEA